MFNPGLIFEAGEDDWLSFLEGVGLDTGRGVEAIDPSDYNSPSIAIGKLVGTQTVTRRVTAVKPGSYRLTTSLPGVATTVNPSTLVFNSPGQTKTVTIRLTPTVRAAGQDRLRVPVPERRRGDRTGADRRHAAGRGRPRGGHRGRGVRLAELQRQARFHRPFPTTEYGLAAADVQKGVVSAVDELEDEYTYAGAGRTRSSPGSRLPPPTRGPTSTSGSTGWWTACRRRSASRPHRVEPRRCCCAIPSPGTYLAVVSPFSDPPGQTSTSYIYTGVAVGAGPGNYAVTPENTNVTITCRWS